MNVVKMLDGRRKMADVIPLPRKMDDGRTFQLKVKN